jgi:hypothetical protein
LRAGVALCVAAVGGLCSAIMVGAMPPASLPTRARAARQRPRSMQRGPTAVRCRGRAAGRGVQSEIDKQSLLSDTMLAARVSARSFAAGAALRVKAPKRVAVRGGGPGGRGETALTLLRLRLLSAPRPPLVTRRGAPAARRRRGWTARYPVTTVIQQRSPLPGPLLAKQTPQQKNCILAFCAPPALASPDTAQPLTATRFHRFHRAGYDPLGLGSNPENLATCVHIRRALPRSRLRRCHATLRRADARTCSSWRTCARSRAARPASEARLPQRLR